MFGDQVRDDRFGLSRWGALAAEAVAYGTASKPQFPAGAAWMLYTQGRSVSSEVDDLGRYPDGDWWSPGVPA